MQRVRHNVICGWLILCQFHVCYQFVNNFHVLWIFIAEKVTLSFVPLNSVICNLAVISFEAAILIVFVCAMQPDSRVSIPVSFMANR